MNCLLCQSLRAEMFYQKKESREIQKEYWRCPDCRLIFLDPLYHLSAQEEKARYDTHRNSPEDEGYVRFLNRLAEPLVLQLKPGDKGLDYGCGPGPTLSHILEDRGFPCSVYDPYYFPKEDILDREFDYVTCSEVIEHFRQPSAEFTRLNKLLKRGSRLGLMTQILIDESQFADWWYHKDPTHACFYQDETFDWIAGWQNWGLKRPQENVVIFSKE